MTTPLFTAATDGDPRGGVVVIQEAFGITSHIEAVCRRFAAEGWYAVAPHLFHRVGDPVFAYDGGFDAIRPAMESLAAETIAEDVDGALGHLATEVGIVAGRTAIVGYCMGGSVSLATAVRRPLGAAVTYYGGGLAEGRFGYPPLLEIAKDLKTPWLGLFGDLDQGIPLEQVERLRLEAAKSSVETAIVRYVDAGHGFNCDDRPSAFNAGASEDGWSRTLDWFAAHAKV